MYLLPPDVVGRGPMRSHETFSKGLLLLVEYVEDITEGYAADTVGIPQHTS